MNITVSVFGRFHAFYLARELERRGHLRRLITSHPKFSVGRWGVSPEVVSTLWPLEAGRRIFARFPSAFGHVIPFDRPIPRLYESLAARRIPPDTDLFVGWSNTAEKGISSAQQLSAITVVERGSSHIRTQRRILREEYQRHGVKVDLPPDSVVRKEEREYKAAHYVVVPSSFAERTFLERGFSSDRLIRLPLGVDPTEFAPLEKRDDVFRVIFAGQLGFRKGLPYLLQAWEELDLPGAELLLLGPVQEEFRPWMEQYRGNYRYPGNLPQGDLHKWYSQGSVFVLPSVEDGFGMVLTQAMACGLPIIATSNTGAPDLVEQGQEGFVVPIQDVEALKERLRWCYEYRTDLSAMGEAARRKVLNDFTWRRYGERVVAAYQDLVQDQDEDAA